MRLRKAGFDSCRDKRAPLVFGGSADDRIRIENLTARGEIGTPLQMSAMVRHDAARKQTVLEDYDAPRFRLADPVHRVVDGIRVIRKPAAGKAVEVRIRAG